MPLRVVAGRLLRTSAELLLILLRGLPLQIDWIIMQSITALQMKWQGIGSPRSREPFRQLMLSTTDAL